MFETKPLNENFLLCFSNLSFNSPDPLELWFNKYQLSNRSEISSRYDMRNIVRIVICFLFTHEFTRQFNLFAE